MNGVITFPDDYKLLQPLEDTNIKLACGFGASEVCEAMGEGEFRLVEASIDGRPLYVALRGFKVFDPPRVSQSQGSRAQYLASVTCGKVSLLLQLMPPQATTSAHFHRRTREAFHSLAGKAALRTNFGMSVFFEPGASEVIDPFIAHWVETAERDSLVLIEMVSEVEGLGMSDHEYVEREPADANQE